MHIAKISELWIVFFFFSRFICLFVFEMKQKAKTFSAYYHITIVNSENLFLDVIDYLLSIINSVFLE